MIATGHLITFGHSGTPASVQGTVLALGAAADHLAKRERPSLAAASFLRQTAAAMTVSGTVDLIAASLEDISDVTLALVLPDAGLFSRYLAIAEQFGLAAEQLLANLASVGFSYHDVFGRMAGIDTQADHGPTTPQGD